MERLIFTPRTASAQRGLSLIFSLVALVILSIAIAALASWMQLSSAIVGNYAFQQDAIEASASAAQTAIDWLEDNQASLDSDHADKGYYASSLATLDPTGSQTSTAKPLELVDWDGLQSCSFAAAGSFSSCTRKPFPLAANAAAVNGNLVQWIITRQCTTVGPPGTANPCVLTTSAGATDVIEQGEVTGGGRIRSATVGPYFRIVVRAAGPRNTVSYTETVVHF